MQMCSYVNSQPYIYKGKGKREKGKKILKNIHSQSDEIKNSFYSRYFTFVFKNADVRQKHQSKLILS